jgi:hypothetical protein
VWRIELQIDARAAGQRGSVIARLPTSGRGQKVYDEQASADGMEFELREDEGQRFGVWRGSVHGLRHLSHGFRVQLSSSDEPPLRRPARSLPEELQSNLGPEAELPVGSAEIVDLLQRLNVDENLDPPARMRQLFSFVADEIETVPTASRDTLLTLAAREGNSTGQARLLATMLRTAGIPARLAAGLRLGAPREERETVYVEALVSGAWTPLFPSLGRIGGRPRDLVVLRTGGASLVDAVGIDAIDYRYRVVREEVRPDELTALMLPPSRFLTFVSLYRLPVMTQEALRVMLVIPLAVLVIAFFRNIVGLQTFGTFLPILIPLSLRGSGLAIGLAMVSGVLLTGILGRLFLDRFRLLFVPRLCVLLCLVILVIVGISLGGYSFQSRDVLTGVLLPIVILTMLIERFSISVAEEGARSALMKLLTTTVIVLAAYPLFHAETAAHVMFGFPELVFCAMGLLVLIGGYTGFRLMEIVRFRALAALSRGVEV